jgi:hypothetical protein
MGLDRDETIVRRRLRWKLEFLILDLPPQTAPPTDRDLGTYFDQHADRYRERPAVSFEHIPLNRERRGSSPWAEARWRD